MWFLTTLEKLEKNNLGYAELGDTRTVLFCDEEKLAIEVLNDNGCDIHEYMYDYAVLEWMEPNVMYCLSDFYKERRKWFKYDKERGGYFEIDPPEFVSNIFNIGIG